MLGKFSFLFSLLAVACFAQEQAISFERTASNTKEFHQLYAKKPPCKCTKKDK